MPPREPVRIIAMPKILIEVNEVDQDTLREIAPRRKLRSATSVATQVIADYATAFRAGRKLFVQLPTAAIEPAKTRKKRP